MKREESELERLIREWLTKQIEDDQAENGGSFADAFGRFSRMPTDE